MHNLANAPLSVSACRMPATCCRVSSYAVLLHRSGATLSALGYGELELIQQCLRRRQKQAGLLASATALREAADRRVAEAELGCERRLDDLEASLKARPVACVLAVLQGLGVCSKHGSALERGQSALLAKSRQSWCDCKVHASCSAERLGTDVNAGALGDGQDKRGTPAACRLKGMCIPWYARA